MIEPIITTYYHLYMFFEQNSSVQFDPNLGSQGDRGGAEAEAQSQTNLGQTCCLTASLAPGARGALVADKWGQY